MNGTKRAAEIVLGAEHRKLRRDLRQAQGEVRNFGRTAAQSLKSTVGTAFAGAFGLASLGGALNIVGDVLGDNSALTRLGIQADVSDGAVQGLSNSIAAVSNEVGRSTTNLIDGASRIVTLTGDFKLAKESADELGITAAATGAEIKDLGGVTSAISQNLKIKPEQLMQAFDILVVQGKKGAVELKDLASLLPTLTAGFGAMNHELNQGPEALAKLGAAMQIAMRASGTPAEAATSVNALMKALSKKANELKKQKIQVFELDEETGVKKMRDFVTIIEEMAASKIGKDSTIAFETLGTAEAVRAFNALKDNMSDFKKSVTDGLGGSGTVMRDFERYMNSSAGRMERAWQRSQNAIAATITPSRIEKLATATETFAAALGLVVDNADTLLIVFGAAKLAKLAIATNKWALALGSVHSNVGQVATKARVATAQTAALNTQVRQTNSAVGQASKGSRGIAAGLGQAAAHAGAITAGLMAGYSVGSMLVDKMGWFQNQTVKATEDDPEARAASERVKLKQDEEHAKKLRWKLAIAEESDADFAERTGGMALHERGREKRLRQRLRPQQSDLRKKLNYTEQTIEQRRATAAATTVWERDQARGTDAADDVLAAIERRLNAQPAIESLSRTGSIGDTARSQAADRFRNSEAIKLAAPELGGASVQELSAIADLLRRQLEEQKRQREVQERLAATSYSGAKGPIQVSAPTGTGPK